MGLDCNANTQYVLERSKEKEIEQQRQGGLTRISRSRLLATIRGTGRRISLMATCDSTQCTT